VGAGIGVDISVAFSAERGMAVTLLLGKEWLRLRE